MFSLAAIARTFSTKSINKSPSSSEISNKNTSLYTKLNIASGNGNDNDNDDDYIYKSQYIELLNKSIKYEKTKYIVNKKNNSLEDKKYLESEDYYRLFII